MAIWVTLGATGMPGEDVGTLTPETSPRIRRGRTPDSPPIVRGPDNFVPRAQAHVLWGGVQETEEVRFGVGREPPAVEKVAGFCGDAETLRT